uniref:60S ribosomal export protein NMD3 n=1 Tax=Toxoplasma gondii COUG TaxID=1074873 RepID=A0A2G8XNL4_TOXGO|nr:NMD3 family protein [Toxoplasma gondii COUG]
MQVASENHGAGSSVAPGSCPTPECTYAAVLCCICGCSIPPSPRSICLSCLAQQVDITEGISRSIVLPCCRTCGRYMHIQNKWLACELESRELMAVCLKKVRGLKKVEKIVDCQWLWTEPHSRRVKMKLTVQSDVLDGRAGLQQSLIIEGVIQNTQCDECKKSYTPHAGWTAMVQVRQHAEHKRTFLFLEQLVLKHRLAARLLNVVEKSDGLDFHFPSRQAALHFADFCQSRFPSVSRQAKQLISHDASSNIYYHKYTISVTLAPVCKDDLVYIHRKQAQAQLGGFTNLSLCTRVAGAGIQLTDPFSGKVLNVSPEKYWKSPFQPLCTRKHLSSFLVLDVNPVDRPGYSQTESGSRRDVPRKGKGRATRSEPEGDEDAEMFAGLQTTGRARGGFGQADQEAVTGQRAHGKRKKKRRNSSPTSHGGETMWHSSGPEGGRTVPTTSGKASTRLAASTPSTPLVYEVELARASDVGVSDRRVVTYTHLGRFLSAGDWVKGYDLRSINLPGAADNELERDAGGCRASATAGKKGRRRGGKESREDAGNMESDDDFSNPASLLKHEENQEQGLAACVRWEVVIVKKVPAQQMLSEGPADGAARGAKAGRIRPWVLQTLRKERDTESGQSGKRRGGQRGDDGGMEAELEEFKEELEEDSEMRAQVNLWKDPRYTSQASRDKKKAQKDGKKTDGKTGKGAKAGAHPTEATHKEAGKARAGDEMEPDDSGEYETYSEEEDDSEELAQLMEGLTLENGVLKGVTVEPGARLTHEGDDDGAPNSDGKSAEKWAVSGSTSSNMNIGDDGDL